jgi:hypothetical protein
MTNKYIRPNLRKGVVPFKTNQIFINEESKLRKNINRLGVGSEICIKVRMLLMLGKLQRSVRLKAKITMTLVGHKIFKEVLTYHKTLIN